MKYLLLLPSFIFYLLFTIWPLIKVFELSLFKTNFITSSFVGFDNYINSFQDQAFIQSVINSVFYVIVLVPSQILVSLSFALLLYRMSRKWQDISRIFIYLPTLSAGIIIASLWRWVFHFNGLANWLIGLFGLKPVEWFGGFFTAIPTISFIVVFASFGANVILFLSSIQGISKEYLEAATIDGANWFQIKRFIILPMIKPTILMIGMLSAIAALMIYETIFYLAPYEYSSTITYQIYKQGFQFGKYGMASAQAILLLFVSIGLFMVKKRFEKND